ncbi:MAG: hypothetical protein Q8M84_11240 [Thiobacillus sp.]|nr:hypothetical protein [Thiobacillus sp.]
MNATELSFDRLLHTETCRTDYACNSAVADIGLSLEADSREHPLCPSVNFPIRLVPVIGPVQRKLPLLMRCCRESPYSLTPVKEVSLFINQETVPIGGFGHYATAESGRGQTRKISP